MNGHDHANGADGFLHHTVPVNGYRSPRRPPSPGGRTDWRSTSAPRIPTAPGWDAEAPISRADFHAGRAIPRVVGQQGSYERFIGNGTHNSTIASVDNLNHPSTTESYRRTPSLGQNPGSPRPAIQIRRTASGPVSPGMSGNYLHTARTYDPVNSDNHLYQDAPHSHSPFAPAPPVVTLSPHTTEPNMHEPYHQSHMHSPRTFHPQLPQSRHVTPPLSPQLGAPDLEGRSPLGRAGIRQMMLGQHPSQVANGHIDTPHNQTSENPEGHAFVNMERRARSPHQYHQQSQNGHVPQPRNGHVSPRDIEITSHRTPSPTIVKGGSGARHSWDQLRKTVNHLPSSDSEENGMPPKDCTDRNGALPSDRYYSNGHTESSGIMLHDCNGAAGSPDQSPLSNTPGRLSPSNTPHTSRSKKQLHHREAETALESWVKQYGPQHACGLFPPSNPVRAVITEVVTSPHFDAFIMGCILMNCVLLACLDPVNDENPRNKVVESFEFPFTIIFAVEMVLKWVAFGLVLHNGSYFRDPWNWLDAVVVVCGFLSLLSVTANLSSLRTVRVLRPLRTIKRVPEMKHLVNTLLESLPKLLNVVFVLMFLFVVFSLTGIQLFIGGLHGNCYYNGQPLQLSQMTDNQIICGYRECPALPLNRLYDHYGVTYAVETLATLSQSEETTFPADEDASVEPGSSPYDLSPVLANISSGGNYSYWESVWEELTSEPVDSMATTDLTFSELLNLTATATLTNDNGADDGDNDLLLFTEGVCVDSSVNKNPNDGVTSFDNFGWALLTNFQVLTLEGWTDIMYMCQDGVSNWAWLYFVTLVFVGSMFVVNLMLAVISTTFNELKGGGPHEGSETESARADCTADEVSDPEAVAGADSSHLPDSSASADDLLGGRKGCGLPKTAFQEELAVVVRAKNGDCVGRDEFQLLDVPHPVPRSPITPTPAMPPASDATGLSPGKPGLALGVALPARSKVHVLEVEKPSNKALPPMAYYGTWNKLQDTCLNVANSRQFVLAITVAIALNALMMGTTHHGQPDWLTDLLEVGNVIFTNIFMIELVVKLVGMGPRLYFADSFNRFDFVIVVVSVVDLTMPGNSKSGSGGITVLRAFRLLRAFKLARSMTYIRKLLHTIMLSMGALAHFMCLMLLFIFIYALIGMNIYGGQFYQSLDDDGHRVGVPRENYDDFLGSFESIFVIVTGENWNEQMYWGLWCCSQFTAVCYFVSAFVLGNYILLNLFLAILLSNFEAADPRKLDAYIDEWPEEDDVMTGEDHMEDDDMLPDGSLEEHPQGNPSTPPHLASSLDLPDHYSDSHDEYGVYDHPPPPFAHSRSMPHLSRPQDHVRGAVPVGATYTVDPGIGCPDTVEYYDSGYDGDAYAEDGPRAADDSEACAENLRTSSAVHSQGYSDEECGYGEEYTDATTNVIEDDDGAWLPGNSCFFFSSTSGLRIGLGVMVHHKYFEWTVLVLIMLSSASLAMDDSKVEDDTPKARLLRFCDLFFTFLFSIEMMVKMLVSGVVLNRNAYLRDKWNLLDCTVVLVSILNLLADRNLAYMRSFRALRALRPLRLISRVDELRIVVDSLFQTMKPMLNVLFFALMIIYIFGVLCVEMVMGKLGYCHGGGDEVKYSLDRDECDAHPDLYWDYPSYGFNHIFQAMLTLFEVTTLEGWTNVMWAVVDSVAVDKAPEKDHSRFFVVLFIIFILICSVFIMNLVVGVVVDTFTNLKKHNEGSAFLTERQKMWVEMQKLLLKVTPKPLYHVPQNRVRRLAFEIVMHWVFDLCIILVIILNTLVMCTRHYEMSDSWENFHSWTNIFFSSVYVAEAALKLVAFSPHIYFSDPWNRFDFTVVIGSILSLTFTQRNISFLRLIRVLRVFKLMKKAGPVRTLLKTLVVSFPTLLNVGALLLLVFFVYAVVGMNVFAYTKQGEYLNRHANFETFWISLLTLFRMSTGENWNGIMRDCMLVEECEGLTPMHTVVMARDPLVRCCLDDKFGVANCGDVIIAPIFFVSFQLLGAFIMLNLFIAVILENFEGYSKTDGPSRYAKIMSQFRRSWARYDPEATYVVPARKLTDLLYDVGPPLGFAPDMTRLDRYQHIAMLDLPVRDGKVYFDECLYAVCDLYCDTILPTTGLIKDLHALYDERRRKMARTHLVTASVAEYQAAEIIQRNWRVHTLCRFLHVRRYCSWANEEASSSHTETAKAAAALRKFKWVTRAFKKKPSARNMRIGSKEFYVGRHASIGRPDDVPSSLSAARAICLDLAAKPVATDIEQTKSSFFREEGVAHEPDTKAENTYEDCNGNGDAAGGSGNDGEDPDSNPVPIRRRNHSVPSIPTGSLHTAQKSSRGAGARRASVQFDLPPFAEEDEAGDPSPRQPSTSNPDGIHAHAHGASRTAWAAQPSSLSNPPPARSRRPSAPELHSLSAAPMVPQIDKVAQRRSRRRSSTGLEPERLVVSSATGQKVSRKSLLGMMEPNTPT
eukprot:Rmarinus@m.20403